MSRAVKTSFICSSGDRTREDYSIRDLITRAMQNRVSPLTGLRAIPTSEALNAEEMSVCRVTRRRGDVMNCFCSRIIITLGDILFLFAELVVLLRVGGVQPTFRSRVLGGVLLRADHHDHGLQQEGSTR